MFEELKPDPNKQYTIFQGRINLNLGFNARNSAVFAKACWIYQSGFDEERGVIVSRVSDETGSRERSVSGSSIIGLLTLEACRGTLLEFQVEGTDEVAKALCEDLKRGLTEEGYLQDKCYAYLRNRTTSPTFKE